MTEIKPERHPAAVHAVRTAMRSILDLVFVAPLLVCALIARFVPKKIEIGLGPVPIINSVYHKQALAKFGHGAEIFVDSVWYYSFGYDYAPEALLNGWRRAFLPYWLTARTLFRYRTLYTYFDGGPLRSTAWLYQLEPVILKIAGIRTVIMAFGADVFDLTRAPNPYFVHAMAMDYPAHRFLRRRIERKIDLWTYWADHIVSGVDWVYYMPYWDTLTLGHFAIDTEKVRLAAPKNESGTSDPLRILHAPNHRTLKGSQFLVDAVKELKSEGLSLELTLLEQRPNTEVLAAIAAADLVVDQLVVGWYAMFALESMALSTACICYIDPDLEKLYVRAGLLDPGEMPLISATPETIKNDLRRLCLNRSDLAACGRRGRAYVEKHHSLDAIGRIFNDIQKSLR